VALDAWAMPKSVASTSQRRQKTIAAGCIVLDTETTGLGDDAEICEITILDVTGAPILDTLVPPDPANPGRGDSDSQNHRRHGGQCAELARGGRAVRRRRCWPNRRCLQRRF
jgi:DNA polymerase III epsilon subunit-like protein